MEKLEPKPGPEKRRIIIEENPGEDTGAGTFYQLRHGDNDKRIAILYIAVDCHPSFDKLRTGTTGGTLQDKHLQGGVVF